jgi:hypothetical protein
MSGGGKTKTQYTQSPEQRQIYATLLPMIQQMASLGTSQLGQPGYGMPKSPTMPSMRGVLSGVSPYQISGYDVPSTSSIMPTTDWWNSLSGDIKAGAWAPFEEGKKNLLETIGASGISGSARGGYSGAAGAGLGEYMADATPAYAMNLWNMSSPGMMAGWQANLGENQYLANLQNQQSQLGYQNLLAERSQDYTNTMNQLNQNYSNQMNAWALPWGLTGMLPQTFSQGITTQQPNMTSGLLGGGVGAGLGYMGGSMIGMPWLGTAVGGLGGLMGGK